MLDSRHWPWTWLFSSSEIIGLVSQQQEWIFTLLSMNVMSSESTFALISVCPDDRLGWNHQGAMCQAFQLLATVLWGDLREEKHWKESLRVGLLKSLSIQVPSRLSLVYLPASDGIGHFMGYETPDSWNSSGIASVSRSLPLLFWRQQRGRHKAMFVFTKYPGTKERG